VKFSARHGAFLRNESVIRLIFVQRINKAPELPQVLPDD
jgi:hypothetical protein